MRSIGFTGSLAGFSGSCCQTIGCQFLRSAFGINCSVHTQISLIEMGKEKLNKNLISLITNSTRIENT